MESNYRNSNHKNVTDQNIHTESEKRKATRYQNSELNDDLPPSGIHRTRNTLPKARQREGPPPEEIFSAPAPTRTVSGENIHSQVYYNKSRGPRRDQNGQRRSGDFSSSSSLRGGRGRGWQDSSGSLQRGRGGARNFGSEERGQRAPSERKISSLQRKKRQEKRASSVPRNPANTSMMTSSLTSSGSLWSPDGKCPSFADILKGSQTTEEVNREENQENPANNQSVGPDDQTQNMQIPEGFGGFQNTPIFAQQAEDSNSFFSRSNTSATVEVTRTTVHEEKNLDVSDENLSEKYADASVVNIVRGLEENKGDDDTIKRRICIV